MMMKRFTVFMLVIVLIFLPVLHTPNAAAQTPAQNAFLNELAKDTWTYLSTRSTHHLPWSWWSPVQEGGSYANPTEIGFHMLAYLAAYEMRQSWSPSFSTVVSEVTATLDQLRIWQTDPANSKDGIFYHWYHVNETPPSVSENPADKALSSIDNTFLAASLIVIREWGAANNAPSLSQKANTILQGINLRLWYDSSTHLLWHGASEPQAGNTWDVYSNENRIINFIARARGQLSPAEFQASLNILIQNQAVYDSITVEKVAYDGSYFTYTAPALFIAEMDTPYGATTIVPATLAQIAYAQDSGYAAWGLSDCYDINTGGYMGQGAPPAIQTGSLEMRAGLVTPHASALALITPLASDAISNLQTLDDFTEAYDANYGFRDSVMVKTGDPNYGAVSNRFSALAQEYILLSIANAQTEFIWRYFYNDAGVRAAHQEMFSPILPSPVQLYPPNGSISTVQQPSLLWQPMVKAVRYELQYGQVNPPVITPITVVGSSYILSSPLAPGIYYWRVRSVNRLNIMSEWSAVWSFTVTSWAGAAPSRNYFTTSTVLLTWYGVPWATGYEVQVDNSPAFFSPEYTNAGLPASATSITTTPLPDGLYYWRVRAKKPDNTWGVWSPIDSFTVAGG